MPERELDRKLYLDVKKWLDGIGGGWSRKHKGFHFPDGLPEDLLSQLQAGERVNLKQEYQFFPTPDAVLDIIEEHIWDYVSPFAKILEPSAGDGQIVRLLQRLGAGAVDVFEIQERLHDKLPEAARVLGTDFMQSTHYDPPQYDLVVANPPFTRGQDMEHVQMMLRHTKRGGRVVSVMSPHFTFAENSNAKYFRQVLSAVRYWEKIELPKGSFSSSGTGVDTVLVIIDK